MSEESRKRAHFKVNNDTGFGNNPNSYGGRFVNRDGSYNMRKEGIPFYERFSLYNFMLNLPAWKFFGLLFSFYLTMNLIFAGIYYIIGQDEFQGMIASTRFSVFKEMYFFSTETFTTVGYGRVNPVGDHANSVAAIESMIGLLSFAVATGLLYGRFSKPKSFLLFSRNALISPYHGEAALMFRFVAYKENHALTNVEIKVSLGMLISENDVPSFQFYDLPLERNRVDSLAMNWTVVHPLNENSPLAGYSLEDMKKADMELYVLVRGYDDVYSSIVQQRTSYTYEEIIFNRKFIPMYRESEDGKTTILELHKLHDYKEAEIVISKNEKLLLNQS